MRRRSSECLHCGGRGRNGDAPCPYCAPWYDASVPGIGWWYVVICGLGLLAALWLASGCGLPTRDDLHAEATRVIESTEECAAQIRTATTAIEAAGREVAWLRLVLDGVAGQCAEAIRRCDGARDGGL